MIRIGDPGQLRDLDLERDLATPAAKRRYVRALFDTVESSYDGFTRLFSGGMDGAWKERMVTLLVDHGLTSGRVLDLATGTGDLVALLEARLPNVRAYGADLSLQMLHRSRKRAQQRSRCNSVADMNDLPYRSGSIVAITAGYAFRNAPDHTLALAEAHRVLEPGGVLVTLDFYLPAAPLWRRAYLGYLRMAGRLIGRALHGVPEAYGYIAASLESWMTATGFSRSLERSGFQVVHQLLRLGGGIAIHLARKPD
jgi:demethylmenaquinone methyltransferase/2-methoxy-6-polyprenyl-1,4-benzoquinol methylase